jgi:hypothetical protein
MAAHAVYRRMKTGGASALTRIAVIFACLWLLAGCVYPNPNINTYGSRQSLVLVRLWDRHRKRDQQQPVPDRCSHLQGHRHLHDPTLVTTQIMSSR